MILKMTSPNIHEKINRLITSGKINLQSKPWGTSVRSVINLNGKTFQYKTTSKVSKILEKILTPTIEMKTKLLTLPNQLLLKPCRMNLETKPLQTYKHYSITGLSLRW